MLKNKIRFRSPKESMKEWFEGKRKESEALPDT